MTRRGRGAAREGLRHRGDGGRRPPVTVDAGSEDLAWAVGSWAVARAADTGAVRVVVGDREWVRAMEDSALGWGTTDAGTGDPQSVTIHL